MGGMTSTFRNNSDLVDNLVTCRFITSEVIEQIFRAVDRGDFFPKEDRINAYRDLAWNSGNIHVSSPCIYGQVMEHFNFSPGLSFLNLGSGTGYLNTMVGLLLGPNGTNHGIEINEYLIQYANEKVDEFEKNSAALDEYEFCRPQFTLGNCFCLSVDFPQYDRVYCGAACPIPYVDYMKLLIKVNGILIMVVDGVLTSYTRTSENTWVVKNLRSIYFASLVAPGPERVEPFKNEPNSLQSLCRVTIRNVLRKTIEKEYADDIEKARNAHDPQKKKRRVLAPINEGSYLETIDTRNETYLMTLLDEFRNEPTAMDPRSILDPAVYNELVQDEPPFRAVPPDDPMGIANSSGESSSEEESSSSSSDDSSSTQTSLGADQPRTGPTNGMVSSSNGNQSSSRQFNWQKESAVVVTDDSDDEPVPVPTIPSLGPYYGQNVYLTKSNDESAEVNIVDVDETAPGNGQPETAAAPGNNSELVTDDSEAIMELAPLVQSLARLGEPRNTDDSDVEIMPYEQQVDDVYISPYTYFMRAKIQALPVPMKLKLFLNLNRKFD